MPALTETELGYLRDQQPNAALVKWYLAVAPYGDPIFTAQVNDPGGDIAYPNMTIPYNNDVGEGDVEPGMTLWIGEEEGGHDRGKVRIISIDTVANELTIAENDGIGDNDDPNWEWDDLYLTCPGEDGFRQIWGRVQRLDGTDLYKDYDIPYASAGSTGDPGVNIPPKANAGPPVCRWLNEDGYVDVDFIAEDSDVFSLGDSITSYDWDFKDGAVQSWGDGDHMGGPASPNVIRFSSAGFRYVELTVTCDNGETGTVYIPVWTFDGDNPPIEDVEISDQSGVMVNDWSANILVMDDIGQISEDALVVVFTDTHYGGTEVGVGGYHDRENIRFVGWVNNDSLVFDHEKGTVEFEAVSHDGRLRQLPGFAFPLEDSDDPSSEDYDPWYYMEDLDVDRAIQWHNTWHNTVNEVCHVAKGDEGVTRQFEAWHCAKTNLYEQVQSELAEDVRCMAMTDRQGIIRIVQDPQYLPVASRDTPICTLGEDDWMNDIDVTREPPKLSYCKIGGFAGTTPLLSRAPGTAPKQAPDTLEREGFIVIDQDELNRWSGMLLAKENNPYPTVVVELAGYWPVFDPALQEYVTLVADDPTSHVDWSSGERFIVRGVSFRDMAEDGTAVTELTLAKDTDGPPGVTVTIPDVPEPEPLDPWEPPPPPPPPPGPTFGFDGKVYVGTKSKGVYYTENFDADQDAHPIWTAVNTGLGSLAIENLILDPWDPLNNQLCIADGVVYRRLNQGNWTAVLPRSKWDDWFGRGAVDTESITGTIHAENYFYAVARTSGGFGGKTGVARSTDGGATWSDLTEIGSTYNYGIYNLEIGALVGSSGYGSGVMYIPIRGGAGGVAVGFRRSLDGGLNWTTPGDHGSHGYIRVDPSDQGIVYFYDNTYNNLYRCQHHCECSGTGNWEDIDHGGGNTNDVLIHVWNNSIVRALAGDHIYKSTDFCASWVDKGATGHGVGIMGGLSDDVDQLFLARRVSGTVGAPHVVFASRNDGDTMWWKGGLHADQTDGGGDSIPYNCGGVCFRGIIPVWTED